MWVGGGEARVPVPYAGDIGHGAAAAQGKKNEQNGKMACDVVQALGAVCYR